MTQTEIRELPLHTLVKYVCDHQKQIDMELIPRHWGRKMSPRAPQPIRLKTRRLHNNKNKSICDNWQWLLKESFSFTANNNSTLKVIINLCLNCSIGRQGFAFWIEWRCDLETGNQAETGVRQERIIMGLHKCKTRFSLSSFYRSAWQCDGRQENVSFD